MSSAFTRTFLTVAALHTKLHVSVIFTMDLIYLYCSRTPQKNEFEFVILKFKFKSLRHSIELCGLLRRLLQFVR
jgi:hypothetical protein